MIVKTLVGLNEELLEWLDDTAEIRGKNRSEVIRDMLDHQRRAAASHEGPISDAEIISTLDDICNRLKDRAALVARRSKRKRE